MFDTLTFVQSIPFMKHIRGGLKEGTHLYIQGSIPENVSMWVQKASICENAYFPITLPTENYSMFCYEIVRSFFFFFFCKPFQSRGNTLSNLNLGAAAFFTWLKVKLHSKHTVPLLSKLTPPCQNRKIWGLNASLLTVNGGKKTNSAWDPPA